MSSRKNIELIARSLRLLDGEAGKKVQRDYKVRAPQKKEPENNCPHCGSYVKPGSKFCESCWEKL